MKGKMKNALIITAILFAFFALLIAGVIAVKGVEWRSVVWNEDMGHHTVVRSLRMDWSYLWQSTLFAAGVLLEFFIIMLLVVYIRKNERSTEDETDKQIRVLKRRGVLTLVCAAAVVLLAFFLGRLMNAELYRAVFIALLVLCAVLPFALIAIGSRARAKLMAELGGYPDEEMFNTFLQQRKLADEAAKKTKKQLDINRQNACILAWLLGFSGFGCAFFASLLRLSPILTAFVLIYSLLLVCAALNRIMLKTPAAFMDDSGLYVEKTEFPVLYSIAERAAEQVGCTDGFRIAILPNIGSIGIADVDGKISLQTGVQLLSLLSEDELLSIFRHEFSHIVSEKGSKIARYARWQMLGRSIFPLGAVLDRLFFSFLDVQAAFLTELHRFGESVRQEEKADRAMLIGCDKRVAASALIKTEFHSNFEFESNSYDTPSELDGEKVPNDLATRRNRELLERVEKRKDEWMRLIPLEILARNASHPTLKMRLAAMGAEDAKALPCEDNAEFAAEKKKALEFADGIFARELEETYLTARKNALETVPAWENAGKPLVAEEYADVISALVDMGRVSDAEALADRAIAELPEAGRAYACLYKGGLLAKRYDKAAFPLLYEAIETENYVEEGLELIGGLCCKLGDE
jgi:Zn-dependent protease with chaperone function